jgi:hypothetical protein
MGLRLAGSRKGLQEWRRFVRPHGSGHRDPRGGEYFVTNRAFTPFHLSVILSALAILGVMIFDLRIITVPETLQVQYIPDDAYYYLLLAKNFPVFHTWTTDAGHSVTSGFHPLLAYLLSFMYVVFHPTGSDFVRYGLALSSLTTLSLIVFLWLWGLKSRAPLYLLFLALIVSSRNFAYNSVSIMEWPLVILFSSLYCIYFYHNYDSTRVRDGVILFLLGLGGSLSRSDFGLLPLSFFVASFLFSHFGERKGPILIPFLGLLGATTGVFLIFLHNYIYVGELLQSSSRMKAYWAQIYGSGYRRATSLILNILLNIDRRLFTSPSFLLVVLLGAPLLTFILAKNIIRHTKNQGFEIRGATRELTMLTAASLCIVGYIVLYSRSGSIQIWYTANLIAPVFITLIIVSNYITNSLGNHFIRTWGLPVIVVLAVAINFTTLYPVSTVNAPWPHQQTMLETGKYLSQQELDGMVGSWNAGIIGYYQGGTIINLDGLVNNDIYEYAIRNDLPTYLSREGINYIVDFENTLLEEKRRLRGGYDDPHFLKSLRPIKVFDSGEHFWKNMTLYRIER